MKKTAITLFFLLQAACLFSQIPRPEYPRPQFERTDWINLNGEWTYTFDFGASGLERGYAGSKGFDGKIIVPFAPESKLSGVGHTDFIGRIWYQRTIDIPADWSGRNVMLNFGAVYYTSEVYVDGRFVGRHFGGSTSFSYDITAFVKPGGSHSLVVFATSDLRSGKQTAGKQSLQYASHSCDYTRTTGIWQTVWMEAVAPEALARVQMTTDIDQQQLIVAPQFFRESPNTLRVTLRDGGKVVGTRQVRASNSSVVVIPVKKARLWSPEDPFLYDLTYEVVAPDGQVLDAVKSYVGMRKVHIEGNKIYLNNEPYYQRLVLDQGFYPDGIWTAPSDDALRRDIELGLAAGFNGRAPASEGFRGTLLLLGRQTRLHHLGRKPQLGNGCQRRGDGPQLPLRMGRMRGPRPEPPLAADVDADERGVVARQHAVPALRLRRLRPDGAPRPDAPRQHRQRRRRRQDRHLGRPQLRAEPGQTERENLQRRHVLPSPPADDPATRRATSDSTR